MPERLSAQIIGQIALMQSVVSQLPDTTSILTFACRGLNDLPGIGEAWFSQDTDTPLPSGSGASCFPIKHRDKHHATLILSVENTNLFQPYAPYVENFCSVLALLLEERQQRALNKTLLGTLEKRVAERTQELEKEIRERKNIESSLRKSQERLTLALQGARSGIWDWELDTQRVHFDENYYRLAGYPPRGIPESYQEWTARVHPDDLEEVEACIEAYLHGKTDRFIVDFRFRRGDGEWMWIQSQGVITERDAHGKALRFTGIHTDIDNQHKAEKELENARQQLLQKQKMEAVGQLAGGIAHDFNNQLGGIIGYADILLSHISDARLRNYIEGITTCATRSADLTHQLLAFARKGQYRKIPVDLHQIIQEVSEILQHSIDRRIEIRLDCKAKSATTTGDPTQIQSALLNLGLNARDAMPGGGRLTYTTGLQVFSKEECDAVPYDISAGPHVCITVTDTGVGMPPGVMEHIFEPFYTTKKIGEGTGMGLAAVYGTVRQHGGAITVSSEVDRGTSFTLYLPATAEDGPPPKASDRTAIAGSAHILLIDDEPVIRDIGSCILNDLGYRVSLASDGAEGVAHYQDHWQSIDLVILDMIMPRMNGTETFHALRAIHPSARIILSSGYSISEEAQALMEEGALAFVGKPFTRTELSHAVAENLENSKSR